MAAESVIYPSAPSLSAAFRQHRSRAWKRLLELLASIPLEDLTRPSPGAAGKSLRDVFVHALGATEFWISLLEGRAHDSFPPEEFPDAPALVNLSDLVETRMQKMLSSADPDWFGQPATIRFRDGSVEQLVPAWVVLHVLTHEYHHKGQIVAIARSLGHVPPDTDFF